MGKDWVHGLLVTLALATPGCFFPASDDDGESGVGGSGGSGGSGGTPPQPIGPVASNATEAWPKKPDVAPITVEQIASACVAQVACQSGTNPVLETELCIGQITWSAERAIPLSNLLRLQERAEFLVPCVLESAGDCAAVAACATGRNNAIYCEEDGCRPDSGQNFLVSCEGAIATLADESGSFTRDCSRAFAECDPTSKTGCTDRQFTACPASGSTADRCDGNIRLGCDGAGQVSYHDCSRMGGVCGTTPEGKQDCIYTSPPDAGCEDPTGLSGTCTSGQLSVCVLGKRVTVPAAGVCPVK
jgi:hypothetical protein